MKNKILELICTYTGKVNSWAWHKRWNKGRRR